MGRASRRKQNRRVGKRSTTEILQNARRALQVARRGAQDLRESRNADRRMTGFRNVVVFGRSVAHILEHLRSAEPSFNTWYQGYQNDPALEYLIELRNRMLKEGEIPARVKVHIAELDGGTLARNLPPAPPGATDFFIGDEFGGNGWVVELAGGETEKFYVELPRVPGLKVDAEVRLIEAPPDFQHMSVEDTCDRFMRFLGGMVADAERHFVKT